MPTSNRNPMPKVHPATREMLPDDPLDLHGVELPGDTELMMRLLVEEYARMGWGLEAIMQLARDPFYQGFHGLWRLYGEEELRRRISTILSRVGVTRVRTVEKEVRELEPELQLVQIRGVISQ
jgi:hypothetical protein